jgi:hypothetical protein
VLVGMAKGMRWGVIAAGVSVSILGGFLLWIFVPGWLLMAEASQGDAAAQYRLAKWYCIYPRKIDRVLYWPVRPDRFASYAWLERAAAQDYPPAIYALGVRIKRGFGVPRPPDWMGSVGWYPQPERGQALIDKAIRLGYVPIVDEASFHYHVFCEVYLRDPHG